MCTGKGASLLSYTPLHPLRPTRLTCRNIGRLLGGESVQIASQSRSSVRSWVFLATWSLLCKAFHPGRAWFLLGTTHHFSGPLGYCARCFHPGGEPGIVFVSHGFCFMAVHHTASLPEHTCVTKQEYGRLVYILHRPLATHLTPLHVLVFIRTRPHLWEQVALFTSA